MAHDWRRNYRIVGLGQQVNDGALKAVDELRGIVVQEARWVGVLVVDRHGREASDFAGQPLVDASGYEVVFVEDVGGGIPVWLGVGSGGQEDHLDGRLGGCSSVLVDLSRVKAAGALPDNDHFLAQAESAVN